MRTINISQKDVAAMKAYKNDLKTMADHFGISIKDMRSVLVSFGFAKPTKNSVDYVINLDFDFPIPTSTTPADITAVRDNWQDVTPVLNSVDDSFDHNI